jgi:hypothetical protein
MGGMLRRTIAIICILGLIVLIATPVVTQFWALQFRTSIGCLYVGPAGPVYWFSNTNAWNAHFVDMPSPWTMNSLLQPPYWSSMNGIPYVLLPWWLLLLGWGLLTGIVWRMLCRRNLSGRGFPV